MGLKATLASLTCLAVVACGSSNGQPSSPTPLSQSELQRLYQQAANAYNTAETPITQAENLYCGANSPSANLAKCETALSQDRQATIAYDNAVRSLAFPTASKSDATKLLADDGQLESLLEQASTAPSLSAINALTSQIFSLLATTANDANRLRADLGLPAASAPPSGSPSPGT